MPLSAGSGGDLAAPPGHPLVDAGTGADSAPKAEASLAATPEALTVVFRVQAEPPLTVSVRESGGDVVRDECVELFVASPSSPGRYQEIVVHPAGALYGARVRNPDDSRATWQLAPGEGLAGVHVTVDGEPKGRPPTQWVKWRCRLRLPWASLPGGRPPADGEERRGNAMRIARGRTTRFLALSATLRASPPDFHVPSRFARLVFPAGTAD